MQNIQSRTFAHVANIRFVSNAQNENATALNGFADADRSPDTVVREFSRLKRLAREKGMAVGIGHPYPATLDLLERELPRLADEGIQLVGIGEYVRRSRRDAGFGAAGDSAPVAAGSVE
jgi:polysaccharide deacetylase 2 family uncharacterized protein YibQ